MRVHRPSSGVRVVSCLEDSAEVDTGGQVGVGAEPGCKILICKEQSALSAATAQHGQRYHEARKPLCASGGHDKIDVRGEPMS